MKNLTLIYILTILILSSQFSHAQILVNQSWAKTFASPDFDNFPASPWEDINWSTSAKDNFGNLIIVGNTLVGSGNTDVLVTKYDINGNILWEKTFDGSAGSYDYGIAFTTDLSGNIYVAASTASFSSASITTLKYSPSGSLQWNQSFQVPSSLYQSPSAITLDNNGNIIVAGGSYSSTNLTDWIILKYNNNGSLIWSKNYDYNNLHEIPANIKVLSNNDIVINGFSSPIVDTWDFVSLTMDKSSGSTLTESRTNLVDLSIEKGFAFDIDDNSNIFIAGTSQIGVGNDNDLKLIKLNESFEIEWDANFDGNGLDDTPKSIASNSAGDIILIGDAQTSQGETEILVVKVSGNGQEIWRKNYSSPDLNGYTKAVKVVCTPHDEIFLAGTIKHQNEIDYSVIMYDTNGATKLERIYNHSAGSKDIPTDLIVNENEIIITGTTEGNGKEYTTVKYSFKKKSLNPVMVNNKPSHNDQEIIVKFHSEFVNETFVNDKRKRFGSMDEVLPPAVVNQIVNKLGINNERSEVCVIKIFHRMTTTDTTSVTRLGRTISIPKFWCTFLFRLPESIDENSAVSVFNTMPEYVEYAELNHLREPHAIPNDTYFTTDQANLFPTAQFPNANINVEPAWDIQSGGSNVKVSINDEPIFWAHEDFGDGTFIGSNIVGGWDFVNNVSIANATAGNHGTSVAGIIGALKNNNTGIAGIAGGDVDGIGNTGAQLFSLGLDDPNSGFITADVVAAAVVEGAVFNPTTGFGYGLNVQNNSYGGGFANTTERNAIKVCFQNECTFVASRGNNVGTQLQFPACYEDDWQLNVGASNTMGNWKEGDEATELDDFESGRGGGLDVIAPGSLELIPTTIIPSTEESCVMDANYTCFGRTSAAAPHVSGLAALMYAEHQVSNGQWNNLAPDDIEHLIQVNATDVETSGYDDFSGFGRIDASTTINEIVGPERRVFHSLAPASRTLSTAVNQEVIIPLGIANVPAGTYYGERITIVDSYLDIFANYEIVDWWDRLSGNNGISAANPVSGDPWGNYSFIINNNVASITATTYTYHLTNTASGQSIDIWYPAPPNDITTAYSLHLRALPTSISEILEESGINLYPNPATNKVIIELVDENTVFKSIQLFDYSGRVLQDINYDGTGQFELNLSKLSAGSYLCKVITNNTVFYKTIIKH